MREQFLVEVINGDGDSAVQSLTELNRLFTAWCHQQYHRSVHGETGATPVQRYHADDHAAPRPDPAAAARVPVARTAPGHHVRHRVAARQPL